MPDSCNPDPPRDRAVTTLSRAGLLATASVPSPRPTPSGYVTVTVRAIGALRQAARQVWNAAPPQLATALGARRYILFSADRELGVRGVTALHARHLRSLAPDAQQKTTAGRRPRPRWLPGSPTACGRTTTSLRCSINRQTDPLPDEGVRSNGESGDRRSHVVAR
jgi:hypothetical protein